MAHEIPYVATATIADLHDLEDKVERAMSIRGARYLHLLVTCPLGWGCASSESIQVARLATQCGLQVISVDVKDKSWDFGSHDGFFAFGSVTFVECGRGV